MAEVRVTTFFSDIMDSLRERAAIISITVVPSSTDYVVVVDSLLSLVVGEYIEIGGVSYKITVITPGDPSVTIDAEGLAVPSGTEYKTSYPYFLHGRFIAINNVVRQIPDSFKKYPIAYLPENFTIREDIDKKNQVGDTVSCTFFFMAPADYTNWLTEDHYDNVIDAMNDLATKFINKLKTNEFIIHDDFVVLDRINWPKWGIEIINKGVSSYLFDDNLSGVEIRLEVPIKKSINHCGRYNNIDFRSCAGVTIFRDGIYEQTKASGTRFDYSSGSIADVDVLVNGVAYSTETAPTSVDIPVKNSNGDLIGVVDPGVQVNIQDSFVENSDASFQTQFASVTTLVLNDVTVTVKNSNNDTVNSEVKVAATNSEVTAPDGNVGVQKSNGDIITIQATPSGATVGYLVPDSTAVIKNSENTIIKTEDILAATSENIPLVDVTHTQPNGSTTGYPSAKNFSCTQIGALLDADLISQLTDIQLEAVISGRLQKRVVQFTNTGANTYNKPSDLVFAFVVCIGGGGGAGSGRRYTAGVGRSSGGSGSAGCLARRFLRASEISNTENITVGGGGVGGAAQVADTSNGNQGTAGQNTSFGSLVVATGGDFGRGGGTSGAAAVATLITAQTPAQFPLSMGNVGGVAGDTAAGTNASTAGFSNTPGNNGGAGGGVSNTNVHTAGGNGSRSYDHTGTLSAVVSGGSAGGGAGSNGLNNVSLQLDFDFVSGTPLNTIGFGTSGAGSGANSAGGGGQGGDGGNYGAAGGSAGGGTNGVTGGRGGHGAQGCCLVFEYYV